jgi:Flp pilus assembly secretin CpaC
VVYTVAITNTGNVVDTVNLLAAGNAWATTLSSPSVTLAAGESQSVTVGVSIPLSATDQETDTATVTATSQGDLSKTDSAVLATTAIRQQIKVFLPAVMKLD